MSSAGQTSRRQLLSTVGAGVVGLIIGGAGATLIRTGPAAERTVTVTAQQRETVTQPGVTVTRTAELTRTVEKTLTVEKQFPQAPEAIRIGYSISLTGQYAAVAKRQHDGVLMWADWVNRQGGLFVAEYNKKIPVRVIYYDDESNTERAIVLYEKLVTEDKVHALLGPYGSPLTAAVAPIAEKHKKVMITSLGSDDYIFEKGYKYLVQPLTPASQYLYSSIDFLKATDPSANKVAVIYRDVAFTKVAGESAVNYARQQGLNVVYVKSYPDKISDLSSVLLEVKASNPDALLIGSHIADGTLAVRQLKELNINLKFVSVTVAITEPAFVEGVGGYKAVEGLAGPSQWEVGYNVKNIDYGPNASELIATYTAKTGIEPTYHTTAGFAGALYLGYAIEKAGTLDNDEIRKVFNTMTLSTVYGDFKIDPATGKQLAHKMVLVQWQGGKKAIIWPPEGATAKAIYPIPTWDSKR
ncbi:MAG: amino acid ABC transporter substrate-binding protein [Candidatus Caldarchaeum sp.]|uniref:Branched-chain amino acid ABC transporter substrate-binding protein n=1 Tax=Caldiarchaeum subterraneum TaxID=311458 RepID=A0A7C5LBY9_CALS0